MAHARMRKNGFLMMTVLNYLLFTPKAFHPPMEVWLQVGMKFMQEGNVRNVQ